MQIFHKNRENKIIGKNFANKFGSQNYLLIYPQMQNTQQNKTKKNIAQKLKKQQIKRKSKEKNTIALTVFLNRSKSNKILEVIILRISS